MSAPRLIRVVELIHQRRARRERMRRSGPQRALAAGALLLGALSVLAAIGLLFAPQAYAYLTRDLPALETLPQLFDPQSGALLQPTIFHDANGAELLRLEHPSLPRRFIDIQAAPVLASALVASRQPDYWTRPLFNRAAFDSPLGIAEELIQEFLYPLEESGWLQTLQVRLLAAQLVERYGRAEVLSWYANSRVFGYYAVGVEAASQLYFGKAASQLTLAEASLLAPVIQAPALNPIDAPQLAIQRQQALLLEMLDLGLINEGAVTDALVQPLGVQPAPTPLSSLDPEFTELALAQLQEVVGFERALRGGLTVETSFDTELQAQLDALLAAQPGPQALVLDPASGQVLALRGQITAANHPADGLLSPFAYLTAFARNQFPASLAWGTGSNDPEQAAKGPVSLRESLANQYGSVFDQILAQVGSDEVVSAASQAGFAGWADSSGQASLLDAAQAYATLANLGAWRGFADAEGQPQPSLLVSIIGPDGEVLLDASQASSVQVFSPELAFLVTDVLADASVHADANQQTFLRQVGRPAALHVDLSDLGNLAIAYSPQRVVLVSVPELDDPVVPLAAVFQAAHLGLPIQAWQTPSGLASAVVCVPGGGLPGPDCPQTRREIFLTANAPTSVDTLYHRVAINRLSGNLATVFTAPEFVEERLFVNVPDDIPVSALPEGIAAAPEVYDSFVVPAGSERAALLEPAAFDLVAGEIELHGNANGADFADYQLAVGRGLRPIEWVELEPASATPVRDGQLGSWDTRDFADGLYAIRLQVRDANGGIETIYSLVTVDNQAPELELLSDLDDLHAGREFSIRLLADDAYGIAGLDVYINGVLLGRVEQAPYVLSAELAAGAHTLRVIASDQAGNVTDLQLDFEVAP